jgi:amino acid transporter
VVSLTLLLIVSAVMVTQPQLIQVLIQMGGGSFGIICIICSFSLIFLRHYRKDVKPSFKVPGGLAIPILAIAIILLAMTQYEGVVYYLTAGWIGCGGIYYLARYLTKTGIFSQKVTG